MRRAPGDRLRDAGSRLWRWFFPERIELGAEPLRILRAIYPALDLAAVTFHRGVPHLFRLTRSQAITLPALLARRRTRIYVMPGHWKPDTVEGLGLLVHEAYHALQAQEAGWGCGPLRPFLILYFAGAAANRFRYRGHTMEEAAYRLAGRRSSPFESTFESLDDAAVEPGSPVEAIPSTGLRFWPQLASSTPRVGRPARTWALALLGLPAIAPWLLLWTFTAALAWLARVLVEILGALAAAVAWGLGACLAAFSGWIRRWSF